MKSRPALSSRAASNSRGTVPSLPTFRGGLGCGRSVRQRIRTHLEMHDLGQVALAAFQMERRAVAGRGPNAPSLPAAVRIVDAAVHALGIEAHRIRHAHIDE